ncbi:hypothetical protein KI387_036758, partial [Taxus chinensis]
MNSLAKKHKYNHRPVVGMKALSFIKSSSHKRFLVSGFQTSMDIDGVNDRKAYLTDAPTVLHEALYTKGMEDLHLLQPQICNYYSETVTPDWLAQAKAAVPHGQQQQNVPTTPKHKEEDETFQVIEEFNKWRSDPELAEAVAAIKALAAVIKRSQANTMMELEHELTNASDSLKAWNEMSISLSAGCDLFMRYVTRTNALEYEDFSAGKSRLIERGERFGEISFKARKTIAMLGQDFVRDCSTILVHGFSRVVLALLKMAALNGKHFSVICTEGRPDNTGIEMSKELIAAGVPVKLILDSAVAYTMEKIDTVLFGADGVVESGGIINMIGTYQTALVAHSMNKPVYVAAESFK